MALSAAASLALLNAGGVIAFAATPASVYTAAASADDGEEKDYVAIYQQIMAEYGYIPEKYEWLLQVPAVRQYLGLPSLNKESSSSTANKAKEEKKGFFSMTDRDFLYCIKNCMDYVSAFKQLAADNGYLTENLNKLKEQREQYFNAEPSMSPKESVDEARQKNAAPKKTHENENVKKMDIMIVSDIEKTEDGKCWCYATYNGRRFILEFPGLLPKLELDKKFTACLKVGKDKCYYIGS